MKWTSKHFGKYWEWVNLTLYQGNLHVTSLHMSMVCCVWGSVQEAQMVTYCFDKWRAVTPIIGRKAKLCPHPPDQLITAPAEETLYLVMTQAWVLMRKEAPGHQPRLTARGDWVCFQSSVSKPHSLPGWQIVLCHAGDGHTQAHTNRWCLRGAQLHSDKHEVIEMERTLLTLVANENGQLVFIIKPKDDLTCVGELATSS